MDGSAIAATTPLGDQLLLQEAEVLGLVGGDQAPDGGPTGAAGAALPVGVELGQPCALLALAEPVDASHARSGGRVLAATAVGEPGRLALAVLAVAGEATTADVEVGGSLLLPRRRSIAWALRGQVTWYGQGASRGVLSGARPRLRWSCAGAASRGQREDGRSPSVSGVVNGTWEKPVTRSGTGQHGWRIKRLVRAA
jgi:hypothetical protein